MIFPNVWIIPVLSNTKLDFLMPSYFHVQDQTKQANLIMSLFYFHCLFKKKNFNKNGIILDTLLYTLIWNLTIRCSNIFYSIHAWDLPHFFNNQVTLYKMTSLNLLNRYSTDEHLFFFFNCLLTINNIPQVNDLFQFTWNFSGFSTEVPCPGKLLSNGQTGTVVYLTLLSSYIQSYLLALLFVPCTFPELGF